MSHHHHHNHRKTDKTIWWVVAGFLVIVVILIGISQGNLTANSALVPGASQLTADVQSFDFGTISMANGKVTTDFTLTNTAGSPIKIKKVYTSCMCTAAKLVLGDKEFGPFGMPGHQAIPVLNRDIAAGGRATIQAIYDPAAHGPAGVGSIVRNVFVETTDGKKLTLTISANVTP